MYRQTNGSGKRDESYAFTSQRGGNGRQFGNQLNNRTTRVSPSDALVELEETAGSLQNIRRSSRLGSASRSQKGRRRFKFYRHECFRYVEGKKVGICGCGLARARHPSNAFGKVEASMQWSSQKCTLKFPTNAFGEIDFVQDVHSDNKRKPYVRVSHKTDARLLLNVMQKEWKLNTPNLVISVTGGAKSFSIKPKIKEAFSKGLIKVAASTKAWVITGGTNAGVMQHVGEAVRQRANVDNKINVLGIAPWGVLQNNNKLISKDGNACKPAEYFFDTSDPSKTGLDVNHTHFFLVDNGTTGHYGTEIELRSRLEETIAKDIKTSSNSTSGAIGIPVVILCLEGGPNTIKTMVGAIQHNTPAVVIDGTGRAADVVCFAYNHLTTDENGVSTIEEQYADEVKARVADVFGTTLMEEVYKNITDLLKDTTMITVLQLDENGQCDVDLAILRALLKANKGNSKIKAKGMIDAIKTSNSMKKGDRSTDVVYLAYKHQKMEDGKKVLDPEFTSNIKSMVMSVFGKFGEAVYEKLVELLKDKEKVDEFQLLNQKKQDAHEQGILNYLLTDIVETEVEKATFQAQLKLALAWNRIDVAESEIFTKDLKAGHYKIEWLYESMFVALSNNKPDFVDLFLNEGLNLKHFLTIEYLEKLYNEIPSSSEIGGYALEIEECLDMGGVVNILEELMGDRFRSRYRDEPYCQAAYGEKGMRDKKHSVAPSIKLDEKVSSSKENVEDRQSAALPQPYLDLFTWAVLCNRKDLALLLWKRSRNPIACAVMASKLLKTLANKIIDNKELADSVDDLLEHARSYEILAVGVLDECRKEKDDLAQTLVVKELEHLGGLTTLDIAVSANNQDFIAHPTCQTLLSRLWMGALYVNTSFWRVLLCIFCPFLVNAVILFREDADAYVAEEDVGEEDQNGVTSNQYAEDENFDLSASLQGSKDSLSYIRMNNNPAGGVGRGGSGGGGSVENGYNLAFVEKGNHLKEDQMHHHENHSIFDHFDDENNESVEAAMRNGGPKTSCLHRILHFYDAPFVKFVTNVLSYLFFLLMYSTIICARFEIKIHPAEYVLHGWVITLILEEVRQFATQEPKGFLKKLEFYFSDQWNIADTISLSVFVVAAVLRYFAAYKNDENLLVAARIVFSTDVVMFFIRLLQIFLVNRHMGPKIVMIRRMLMDLGYFVVIMAVIIVAYGVAQQAVLYPNTRNLWEAFVGVVNRPYWQMYGELFYEDIMEDKLNATNGVLRCKQPNADEPCPDETGRVVVMVYMAIYMLFTNILLLNLLIAIFNYTFEKVQEDSDKVWKFGRYHLISEYHDRPPFFPPLIIIPHIYMFIYWLVTKVCGCCARKSTKGSSLKITLEPEENEPLELWEYGIMEMYCVETTKKEAESQDERVKIILNRVNTLSEDMDEFRYGERQITAVAARPDTRLGNRSNSIPGTSNLEVRLSKLEKNVEYILELLINQSQRKDPQQKSIKIVGKSSVEQSHDIQRKNLVTTLHTKARIPMYPSTTINRCKVPDSLVSWEVDFPDYKPVKYTAPFVLAGPYWADVDLMEMRDRPQLAFNEYDNECQVNRKSHTGLYSVVDGLPRNPFGRTGIIGRGGLGRFGPNHAADPIATRWRRSSSGIETDKGKKILEFIAIMRKDNCQWAIPGGMVEPGQNVSETLRKEFTEEALAKLDMTEDKRAQLANRINHLFRNGKDVYKGYVDDPRNTDNAWMETVACNFHDETGEIFGEFQLKAGDDAQAVRWQRVSGNIPLFASHVGILEQVAKMHDAAFY